MDDLISRQAAIDALGERPIVWDEWTDEYSLGQRNQYDDDKSAIEALPSAQPECKQECMPMYANVCDCISRQAAIAEFSCCELTPDGGIDVNYAIDFLEQLPSVQPEIIRCKDCMHRPVVNDNYSNDERGCGFDIEFPDYKCPCQCEDGFYNRLPDDNWFCGNAERRQNGQ